MENIDTSGFYKLENQELIYGRYVLFPDYNELKIEQAHTYTYPINDYYYFSDILYAYEFFNIEKEVL